MSALGVDPHVNCSTWLQGSSEPWAVDGPVGSEAGETRPQALPTHLLAQLRASQELVYRHGPALGAWRLEGIVLIRGGIAPRAPVQEHAPFLKLGRRRSLCGVCTGSGSACHGPSAALTGPGPPGPLPAPR